MNLRPAIILSLYERLSRHRLLSGWHDLKDLQWRSRDELEARALSKLRSLLTHAGARVPYYRDLFKKVGVSPEDIRTPDDMACIPVTTKTDLRRNFPARTTAENIGPARRREGRTSGSTGLPLEFYQDRASLGSSLASYLFFRQWAGVLVGDTLVYVGNLGQFGPNIARSSEAMKLGRRIFLGERILALSGFDLTPEILISQIGRLPKNRSYMVLGFPSYLNDLAAQIIREDVHFPAYPKVIVCIAETLTPAASEIIKGAFKCRIVNHYSCWEMPHMAQTCPDNDALLHVNCERVLLRVVGEDGSSVSPGEQGRVVVTDLTNFVMPFINYDLGDRATSGEFCSCGRGFPTLKNIEGRTAELIHTPSGKAISPSTLGHILMPHCLSRAYIWEYQAEQTAGDRLTLRIVPISRFSLDFGARLKGELEEFFGPGLHVTIEPVESIPRETSGKRLVIKSYLSESR